MARYEGFANCQGDYIWYVDAGDSINNSSVDTIIRILKEKQPKSLILGYSLLLINNTTKYIEQKIINEDIVKSILLGTVGPCVWGKIFSRKLISSSLFESTSDILLGEDYCFSIGYFSEYDNDYVNLTDNPLYIYIQDVKYRKYKFGFDDVYVKTSKFVSRIYKILYRNNKLESYIKEFEYFCFRLFLYDCILFNSNTKEYQIAYNEFNKYVKKPLSNKYIIKQLMFYFLVKIKVLFMGRKINAHPSEII